MSRPKQPRAQRTVEGSGSELRIVSENSTHTQWRWILAALWIAASAYTVYQVFVKGTPDWQRDGGLYYVILAAFPGLALVLLARAVWATVLLRRFGEGTLVIPHAPVDAGTALEARILVGPAVKVGSAGELTLQCQQQVEIERLSSGKDPRIETRILYELAKPAVVIAGTQGNEVPVQFDIPPEGPASRPGKDPIGWVLAAEIKVGGVGAKMAFEFPVRRAAG